MWNEPKKLAMESDLRIPSPTDSIHPTLLFE